MNDTANITTVPKANPPLRERLQATGRFARQAWGLARPYFHSEERWAARGLLAAIVALNLGTVYMLVLLNDWNRVFYDALQNKDQPVFWRELGHFCWLAAIYMLIAVYKFYLTQSLEIRWRAWLTRHFMGRWLADQTFYRLELQRYTQPGQSSPDNPDQRMQEDLQLFTGYSVSLSMGLLNAVVTLLSFVGILWTLSGAFSLSVGGQDFVIPGFMVWMAVLYCAVGSWLAHRIGRPLAGLNFSQQQKEANFRHHLIRVREHSEAIALDRGAAAETQALQGRYTAVLANAWLLLKAQKRLTWFTSGFAQAATVFPFIIAAPRFFSGAIQLGELMQIASAFGRVQDSLSWLVDNYDRLAGWQATTRRLTSFEDSLRRQPETLTAPATPADTTGDTALSIHQVQLRLPNGQALLTADGLQLQAGQTVLLQGPSGCGKSTLMRAVAGIWPWQEGAITPSPDWMFLPQKPYLPQGSLRQALTYPGLLGEVPDATLQEALAQAHLPHLIDRLDDEQAWDQCLSGGEQQRLALARALVRRPRWVFADEVTSALDEATQAALYRALRAMVLDQRGGLISITHQPALWPLHNTVWQVTPGSDSAAVPQVRVMPT